MSKISWVQRILMKKTLQGSEATAKTQNSQREKQIEKKQ